MHLIFPDRLRSICATMSRRCLRRVTRSQDVAHFVPRRKMRRSHGCGDREEIDGDYSGRRFHPCRTSARRDVSASTVPSPMAGSLARRAASDAPQAAPAICEKPNKAAAAPALSPNGDSAAALDSGLAIPKPNRKTEAAARNGSSEFLATRTARSSAAPPTTADPRPIRIAGKQRPQTADQA